MGSTIDCSLGGWSQFGADDANTLEADDDPRLDADVVAGLEVAWSVAGDGGVTGTPAIVDGVVYYGDWSGVARAVAVADGSLIWKSHLPADDGSEVGPVISASPLVTNERVYVADLAGRLHALDRATGTLLWSVDLQPDDPAAALFSSPVVVDGRIIVGVASFPSGYRSFRGAIVAVDAEAGDELWRVYTGSEDRSEGTAISVWSSAAIDRDLGLLFIGTGNTNQGDASVSPMANAVVAIRYRTGEVAWVYRMVSQTRDLDQDIGAAPNLLVAGGRVAVGVGGKSGDYALIDRYTGEEIWRVHLVDGSPGGGVMAPAAIGDGVIYVNTFSLTGDPELDVTFAIDAVDGSTIWRRDWEGAEWSSPGVALVGDVLFRGSFQSLYALDPATGDILWSDELPGMIGGGMSIGSGYVVVGYNTTWDWGADGVDPGGVVAYRVP